LQRRFEAENRGVLRDAARSRMLRLESPLSTQSRHSLRVTTSAGRDRRGDPLSAWARVREGAFAPPEAIAAETRTAAAPDLAMLVVACCQLRQALG
jgi:hypothetical protein